MRKLKVLLVDDSSIFLNAARDLLAGMPCVASIDCTNSGAQALAQLGCVNPDLVFTDLMMPGMSGFELVRNLHAREAPPCVVVATLHDGAEFRTAARRSGADGFISKREFGTVARELVSHLAGPGDA